MNKQMAAILKSALVVLACAAIVILLLPLLAVVAISLRFVLIAAFVAVPLALAFSPALRRWLRGQGEGTGKYLGIRLPVDELLSPAHAWLRPGSRSELTLGIDDLVQRALGPVEAVQLPEREREVIKGDPLVKLRRGERVLTVRAPFSGKVVRANDRVAWQPVLVNNAPYGAGWLVRLVPDELRGAVAGMKSGREAIGWMRGEVDRLLATMQPGPAAMQDGGLIAKDLHEAIDDECWDRVRAELFGDR